MTKTVANPFTVQKYAAMTAVELRKAAQGKIPNAKSHRKNELIDLLVEWDAKVEAAVRADEAARVAREEADNADRDERTNLVNAKKATKKPAKKTTAKRCQVCAKRPIDRKTQGRDSTMCGPCFEYAGWENTHSDEAHEQGREEGLEFPECPVCQGQDPANDDVKAKVNGSKPGRKVAKPMATESKSFDAKAKAFAAIAKANEWKASVHKVGSYAAQVTAHSIEGETISMVWENGVYQYETSEYKNSKGRKARIRNASAARKIVEA